MDYCSSNHDMSLPWHLTIHLLPLNHIHNDMPSIGTGFSTANKEWSGKEADDRTEDDVAR